MPARRFLPVVAVVMLFTLTADSRAQNFFGGNNTAFDPEIDVVESGVKLDVQATVSADRKYVTMTARPQLSTLIALRQFVFQGPGGVVGFPNANPNQNGNVNQQGVGRNPNGGRAGRNGPLMPAFAKPAPPTPVLHREGMTRIDTPEPVAAPASGDASSAGTSSSKPPPDHK